VYTMPLTYLLPSLAAASQVLKWAHTWCTLADFVAKGCCTFFHTFFLLSSLFDDAIPQ
jgi:hypothetical protein